MTEHDSDGARSEYLRAIPRAVNVRFCRRVGEAVDALERWSCGIESHSPADHCRDPRLESRLNGAAVQWHFGLTDPHGWSKIVNAG
jgi:hypothetical protein